MFCPTECQAAQSRSPLGYPPRIGPGLWVYAVSKPREGPSDHLPLVIGCYFVLHHSFKCVNLAAFGLPWGTEHLGEAGGQQPRTQLPKGHHRAFPLGSCLFPRVPSRSSTQTVLQEVMPTSLFFLVMSSLTASKAPQPPLPRLGPWT